MTVVTMDLEEKRTKSVLPLVIGLGAMAILAVVGVAALLASGVTDDDKPSQTPAVLEGSEVTIKISDFDYSPRDATIQLGATVTWVNADSAPHDAVEDDDRPWATEILDEGESGSVTFEAAGNYDYHCSIHPYMEGTLTIVD